MLHTYGSWEFVFLCSPDSPKQPRTSFPLYKFFYTIISTRISAYTYTTEVTLGALALHDVRPKKAVEGGRGSLLLLSRRYVTLGQFSSILNPFSNQRFQCKQGITTVKKKNTKLSYNPLLFGLD